MTVEIAACAVCGFLSGQGLELSALIGGAIVGLGAALGLVSIYPPSNSPYDDVGDDSFDVPPEGWDTRAEIPWEWAVGAGPWRNAPEGVFGSERYFEGWGENPGIVWKRDMKTGQRLPSEGLSYYHVDEEGYVIEMPRYQHTGEQPPRYPDRYYVQQ